MKLTQTLEEVQRLLDEAKEKALNTVKEAKHQNPKLKPLGSNCFTIKLSDLSEDLILSPQYYDFNWQFHLLINKLKSKGVEYFIPFVEKVVKDKKCDGYRLHPEVIKSLEEII